MHRKKNLELICDIDESLPEVVTGDATRVRQILVNLLSNAVKFSSQGEVIVRARAADIILPTRDKPIPMLSGPTGVAPIPFTTSSTTSTAISSTTSTTTGNNNNPVAMRTVSRRRSSICNIYGNYDENSKEGLRFCEIEFSVQDSGIGIPKEAQQKLFQPFTQADTSTTRRYGGSGLGLTISRRLSELMGGKMWFQSEEGVGSTFHFTIITQKKRASISTVFPEEFTGKNLLLLSPNKTILSVLEKRINSWGVSATSHLLPKSSDDEEILNSVRSVFTPSFPIPLPFEVAIVDAASKSLFDYLKGTIAKNLLIIGYNKSEATKPFIFLKKPVRESALQVKLLEMMSHPSTIQKIEKTSPKVIVESKLRIIIAEDNIMNQKVIERLLKSAGFTQFTTVSNGVEVIKALDQDKYNLILMDVMMPEMGGIETTMKIRRESPYKELDLVIIGLTADAFIENRERCLTAGMNDFLTKPINRAELIQTLNFYANNPNVRL